ncbi:gluconokinase [Halobacillus karajensis]|uniref:Xylulose kinase n=1 Tax=Halobacillus karajensis TaxID=195088 RepID=A0A059NZ43_9BACI|nr:gluconokinase [Halobacillus karajensis]CDQ18889.1 Xylulose kinase [Halobacillus karajensis]CDQ23038.1 Xylulose kinase [Halobacillus karajensis]CDQ26520.1 Xylulose kinase [Halobacillus karajensis]
MDYVIGLDIGTTSAKSVVFHKNGEVAAEYEVAYPLSHPVVGYAEQDPLQIEQAALEALNISTRTLERGKIAGVGISAAMHSLICMDKNGASLCPSMIWADARSASEASTLKEEQPDVYMRTGTPLHPMSPLSKLIWMKNNQYEPWKQADYFVSVKEFLLYRWFGEKVVDYSIAAATGLFNIHEHRWDEETLAIAGIHPDQLFTPVAPTYAMSGMKEDLIEKSGLAPSTPFVIGGSDGPLANLGIGAIQPGETAITIGTSGAIRQFSSEPLLDDKQEVFSYSFTDDLWITGGPSNNGGLVLKWVQQLLSEEREVPIEELTKLAGEVEAGSGNLLFLPYLNGERAPFWNAEAKGSYIGLTPSHKKGHMTRAAMEGVLFSIFHIGKALERLGNHHETIYASGGFARSETWIQMLADIFNKRIDLPVSHQSSAWGAAWVALYSLGHVDDLTSIKSSIPMKEHYEPNADNHQKYQALFEVYQSVSDKLQTDFAKLHRM